MTNYEKAVIEFGDVIKNEFGSYKWRYDSHGKCWYLKENQINLFLNENLDCELPKFIEKHNAVFDFGDKYLFITLD